MTPLLLLLVACPGPPGKDSPAVVDSDSAVDDTGGTTDSPPGGEPLDRCGDGVDNDGDGVVDGEGCVAYWVWGPDVTEYFPSWLEVDRGRRENVLALFPLADSRRS